jgi:3-oxoacyl-(acyl-carrier-protein) synthase
LRNRVLVTGMGIISAIGSDTREVLDSLMQKRSGIGKMTLLDSVYRDEIPVAGIKADNDELKHKALPGISGNFTRTSLFGIIAARQALEQAEPGSLSGDRTGLISATTVGGMDRSEVFYKSYLSDSKKGRLRDISGHDCGAGTEQIARLLGINGFISTINTACSSSANAIIMGARMIRLGLLDRVVAGGTDALTLFTVNGFNSLMILDREPCRPFDENRNGLNLGEGSAFIVMESAEVAQQSGKKILCEISGYGNACDAYHQTASSPEGKGAYLSMKQALESAGLKPDDISYINAHGTGTKNNDLSEGIAIERVFTSGLPAISSTKAFTGHTLGAAGAIEAVISILALQHRSVFPNLNFSQQMNELNFSPVADLKTGISHSHIMSNSFGFGGNNSTLIISRYA